MTKNRFSNTIPIRLNSNTFSNFKYNLCPKSLILVLCETIMMFTINKIIYTKYNHLNNSSYLYRINIVMNISNTSTCVVIINNINKRTFLRTCV